MSDSAPKPDAAILIVEWKVERLFIADLKVRIDGTVIGDVPPNKKRAFVVRTGQRRLRFYAYKLFVPWRHRIDYLADLSPGQYRHLRVSEGTPPKSDLDEKNGGFLGRRGGPIWFVLGLIIGAIIVCFRGIAELAWYSPLWGFRVEEIASGAVPDETLRKHPDPVA